MEDISKQKILGNDLTRRLLNTMKGLGEEEIRKVVDGYGQKLLTSGFSRDKSVRILVSGIRSFEKKLRRCRKNGTKLYRTARQSCKTRSLKKLMGAREWYRRRKKTEEEEEFQGPHSIFERVEYKGPTKEEERERLPTKSVLFVPYTQGGGLAKRLREMFKRLEGIIGGGVKVVERTGTALARQFSLTRLWEGGPCWREDCVSCTQEGETVYPCTRRNLVYENVCLNCHPEAGSKEGILDETKKGVQSVYVGESCRSLYERSKEHWRAFLDGKKDSHMLKHHVLIHGGQGEPRFHIRPIKYHSSALSRQVHEAVQPPTIGWSKFLNKGAKYRLQIKGKTVVVPYCGCIRGGRLAEEVTRANTPFRTSFSDMLWRLPRLIPYDNICV